MSSKIFLIGFIALFTSFSFIETVSAEDLQVQTIVDSEKYNVPYLALTAEEVAAEENLADLVLQRAGRICKSSGYHSAVNFDFETGHEKTDLVYFGDDNIEKVVEVQRKLKPWKVGFDTLFAVAFAYPAVKWGGFAIAYQAGWVRQGEGGAFALSLILSHAFLALLAIPVELGISAGLSFILAERMDDLRLEGTYRKYYVYFSSIDCLEAGEGVSNEQITEYETRYSCNVLQDNDSACNEASLREVSCLVNLSSKDDSLQTCKDLDANIQDDRKFQCAVADIGGYELPAEICSI